MACYWRLGCIVIPGVVASGHQWGPLDVAPMTYWLDASDTSTITSSGGAVSQWTDKISSAAFVQATGANKPTTGAATLNGLNVLSFVHTSGTVGQFLAATGISSVAQPLTICYVAVLSGYDRTQGYNAFGSNGQVRPVYHATTTDTWSMLGGTPQLQGGTSGNGTLMTATVINGSSSYARLNKTQILSGTVGTTGMATNAVVGAANVSGTLNPWNGDIAEILVYPSVLNSTQIDMAENYLRNKWGTP